MLTSTSKETLDIFTTPLLSSITLLCLMFSEIPQLETDMTKFRNILLLHCRYFMYFIIIFELVELRCTSLSDYFLLSELGDYKRSISPLLEVFDMKIIKFALYVTLIHL
jgi:hypothetical protein